MILRRHLIALFFSSIVQCGLSQADGLVSDSLPHTSTPVRTPPSTSSAPSVPSADADPTPSHLILLAAHSIPLTYPITLQPPSWHLEPYQPSTLPRDIHNHITTSITLLTSRPPGHALLIFSGGETRPDAGPRSEGDGYLRYALESGMLDGRYVRWVNSERYARDSWENLVMGVCRFKEMVGSYPRRVTVVSYEFKRDRFENLHAGMLGMKVIGQDSSVISTGRGDVVPEFEFVGIPAEDGEWESVAKGYEELTKREFEHDGGGCKGELKEKREKRGWSRRGTGYSRSCPELKEVMDWCGDGVYDGYINWGF